MEPRSRLLLSRCALWIDTETHPGVPAGNVESAKDRLTREQFAERYGLQARAIQEWEQGRRKPEPAVRAYMLVIKDQPAAVRKALTAV